MATRRKNNGMRFNGEISLGHILTILTITAGGIGVWFATMNDISNLKNYVADDKTSKKELQITMQQVVLQLEKLNTRYEVMQTKWDSRWEERDKRELERARGSR